jgi:hypothetical protein
VEAEELNEVFFVVIAGAGRYRGAGLVVAVTG